MRWEVFFLNEAKILNIERREGNLPGITEDDFLLLFSLFYYFLASALTSGPFKVNSTEVEPVFLSFY